MADKEEETQDPDSGHPTPRDGHGSSSDADVRGFFEQLQSQRQAQLTSTPLPTPRRRSGRGPLRDEPFSPIPLPGNRPVVGDKDLRIVNDVISLVQANSKFSQENEELREATFNTSSRVQDLEHELQARDSTITELREENQILNARTVIANVTVDLRKEAGTSCSDLIASEKENMNRTLEEAASIAEREFKEQKEQDDLEKTEFKEHITSLKLVNEELRRVKNELESAGALLEQENLNLKQEIKTLQENGELAVREKEEVMMRATSTVKTNEIRWEDDRKSWMEKEKEWTHQIQILKESADKAKGELCEQGKRLKEAEEVRTWMEKEKEEAEKQKEDAELKVNEALARISELEDVERAAAAMPETIASLQRSIEKWEQENKQIREQLERAINAKQEAEEATREETTRHVEGNRELIETRMKLAKEQKEREELEDALRRAEKRREEWQKEKVVAEKKANELREATRDVEAKRERMARLEDELDIARTQASALNKEVTDLRAEKTKRAKEEAEKREGKEEQEERKVLEDRARAAEQREKEATEQLQIAVRREEDILEEMRTLGTNFQELRVAHDELKENFAHFKQTANDQYTTEMGAKDEEIDALRQRLALFETYPGQVVSVDGRGVATGRCLLDLLPLEVREPLERLAESDAGAARAISTARRIRVHGIGVEEPHSHLLTRVLSTYEWSVRAMKNAVAAVESALTAADERGEDVTDIESELVNRLRSLEEEEEARAKEENDEKEALLQRLLIAEEEAAKTKAVADRAKDERRAAAEEIRGWKERTARAEQKAEDERDRADQETEECQRAIRERKDIANTNKDLREKLSEVNNKYKENQLLAHQLESTAHSMNTEYERLLADMEEVTEDRNKIVAEFEKTARELKAVAEDKTEVEEKLEEKIRTLTTSNLKLVTMEQEVADTKNKMEDEKLHQAAKMERYKSKYRDMCKYVVDTFFSFHANYERVNDRGRNRQETLEQSVSELAEINRMIGGNARLERLEKTIRERSRAWMVEDRYDDEESLKLRADMEESKENIEAIPVSERRRNRT